MTVQNAWGSVAAFLLFHSYALWLFFVFSDRLQVFFAKGLLHAFGQLSLLVGFGVSWLAPMVWAQGKIMDSLKAEFRTNIRLTTFLTEFKHPTNLLRMLLAFAFAWVFVALLCGNLTVPEHPVRWWMPLLYEAGLVAAGNCVGSRMRVVRYEESWASAGHQLTAFVFCTVFGGSMVMLGFEDGDFQFVLFSVGGLLFVIGCFSVLTERIEGKMIRLPVWERDESLSPADKPPPGSGHDP